MKTARLIFATIGCGAWLCSSRATESPAPGPAHNGEKEGHFNRELSTAGGALDQGPSDREYQALFPLHGTPHGTSLDGLRLPGENRRNETTTKGKAKPKTAAGEGIPRAQWNHPPSLAVTGPEKRSALNTAPCPWHGSDKLPQPGIARRIPSGRENHLRMPAPEIRSIAFVTAATSPPRGRTPALAALGGRAASGFKGTAALSGAAIRRKP